MKGLFFKDRQGEGFEIVSDALMHPEGNIQVVIKRLKDGWIQVTDVADIDTVASENSILDTELIEGE